MEAAVAGRELDSVVFVVVDEGGVPRRKHDTEGEAIGLLYRRIGARREHVVVVTAGFGEEKESWEDQQREDRRRPRHSWFDRRSAVVNGSAEDR